MIFHNEGTVIVSSVVCSILFERATNLASALLSKDWVLCPLKPRNPWLSLCIFDFLGDLIKLPGGM